ncbi:MAG: tetratricopeptide repeat protein [Leptolyngbyaceae cyanobacterium]
MSDNSADRSKQPALDDPKEMAKTFYQAGKAAFESGQYRQAMSMLEKAMSLLPKTSILGGEAGIWLVMAQDAAGRYEDAIALCTKLAQHPHSETAQQGKRLLYILKAPKLKTNPEWNSTIPDLTQIGDGDFRSSTLNSYPKPKVRKRKPKEEPVELEPIDWSQIDTKDNQFIAIALGVTSLLLLGWAWLF